MTLQLTVQRIDQTCLFTLAWGQGQQLRAQLLYPQSLTRFYLDWQRSYQSFYQSAQRARVEAQGSISPPAIDWRTRLAQAEVRLLGEFHHWLRSPELFEIRSQIVHEAQGMLTLQALSLGLTCDHPELERLPWETWELGVEFGAADLQILRVPARIRAPATTPEPRRPGVKARILVIWGDETGLDFQGDRAAIAALGSRAEVQMIGWQPGREPAHLRQEICQAITAPPGWDAILFAGHSDEKALLGGELGLAPGQALSFRELEPYLRQAQQRGLKFALFNSCNGLDWARNLIDLGLGQVAVMREPIHNEAAHRFLGHFLQALAQYQDAATCLQAAAQNLKLEHHLTFPSAYLIPSLFCHPQAASFQLQPRRWRSHLQALRPQRSQAIALALLMAFSLWLPAQEWLLSRRVQVQASYRQLTRRESRLPPPVLLVAIDEASLQRAQIQTPQPMNRAYLADLVNALRERPVRTLGLDYVLSRPPAADDQRGQEQQAALGQALQAMVAQGTNLTLATVYQEAVGDWQDPLPAIAAPQWSLAGSVLFNDGYMPLVPRQVHPHQRLPFSYLLALTHAAEPLDPPQLRSRQDRFEQLSSQWAEQDTEGDSVLRYFAARSQLHPLTYAAYRLRQVWLRPILDYSLPPSQVYEWLPAWELLAGRATPHLAQQVVLIVPGGYGEAGIAGYNQDNLPVPPALYPWFSREGRFKMVGGVVHAYAIHHYLNRHFVLPIPQAWALGVAALLGQLASTYAPQRRTGWLLLLGVGLYGLASLELYLRAQLLLPWVLPAIALSLYALPHGRSPRRVQNLPAPPQHQQGNRDPHHQVR